MKRSHLAYPFIVYALVFFVAPLLLILYYSVTSEDGGSVTLTLQHFARFFDKENPQYMIVLWRSLKLAAISTVLCLIIGYPMAYILSKLQPGLRNLLSLLFILPMWMNFLLRTYAWMALLEKNGIINKLLSFLNLPAQSLLYTDGAVLLGMVYNFLPFMILPIYNMLAKIDNNLLEAAQDLGANTGRTFIKVIFPCSVPGVISGILMTFMPAVSTFVISQLLGGTDSIMIGDMIQKQFKLVEDWGFGSAMSVIVMILILVSTNLLQRFDHDTENERGVLY